MKREAHEEMNVPSVWVPDEIWGLIITNDERFMYSIAPRVCFAWASIVFVHTMLPVDISLAMFEMRDVMLKQCTFHNFATLWSMLSDGNKCDPRSRPSLFEYKINLLAQHPFDSTPTPEQQQLLIRSTQSEKKRFSSQNIVMQQWAIHRAYDLDRYASAWVPAILTDFPYAYCPEIVKAWYPCFGTGKGYLSTPDLKITAMLRRNVGVREHEHNKKCCFCGLYYIAGCNGLLEHAHQVKNCDYIAMMSNDERVILVAVLEKISTTAEFRNHRFVTGRDPETSFLRCATSVEEENGLFVESKETGEKLRINMRVLLGMRERSYTDFVRRIQFWDRRDGPHNYPRGSREGFLYNTLLDHEGRQFTMSKFALGGKRPLRDFTLRDDGFGDSMYFSH